MKPHILTNSTSSLPKFTASSRHSSFLKPSSLSPPYRPLTFSKPSCRLLPLLFFSTKPSSSNDLSSSFHHSNDQNVLLETSFSEQVGNPLVPSYLHSLTKLSLADQTFLLLSFFACTASIAFTSLVIAAVPTFYAMGRAATSFAKLADTAREELPSTMAAIRLSGMEISDLTLELSDLSQEIADGVNKSTQAVQAAEAGIRQLGAIAHQRTVSMIQERANLPTISIQPVVAGAAKKTSRAVGNATKSLLNMISGGEFSSGNEDGSGIDRVEI